MVAMTYKLNPNSEVEDVNAEAIAEAVQSLASDVYDVQAVEISNNLPPGKNTVRLQP